MAKYYVKRQEIVIARQYNGNEIKGVSVRGNKGYITTGGDLVVLNLHDWILTDESGRRRVISNEAFSNEYEFLRADEYDPDDLGDLNKELYKDVVYEKEYSYENTRRKNGSKKGTK